MPKTERERERKRRESVFSIRNQQNGSATFEIQTTYGPAQYYIRMFGGFYIIVKMMGAFHHMMKCARVK